MDCSPTGSSVHGILQARVLEWVAISFSRGSSRPRDRTCISHIVGRCFTIWATKEVLGVKVRGRLQAIMSLAPPRSLHFGIPLGWEVCVHLREDPRVGQVWKKKPDNWPKGRQRPRTALYKWLNPLFTALLLVRRDTHTLSLWVCISALLLSQLNKPFLYVLPYLFCYVSNNKLCTCIDSFCLHDKSIFHWGQRPREN